MPRNIGLVLATLFIVLFASIPIQNALESYSPDTRCGTNQLYLSDVDMCFGINLVSNEVDEAPLTAQSGEQDHLAGQLVIVGLLAMIAVVCFAIYRFDKKHKKK